MIFNYVFKLKLKLIYIEESYFCTPSTVPDIAPKPSPRTIKTTVYGMGHPFINCRTIAEEENQKNDQFPKQTISTASNSRDEYNLDLTSNST